MGIQNKIMEGLAKEGKKQSVVIFFKKIIKNLFKERILCITNDLIRVHLFPALTDCAS